MAVTSDSQGEEKQEEKEARRGRKVARRGDGWRDLARPRVAPCARSIPLAETRFLPFYLADLDSFGRMAGRPLNARIFIRFLVAEKARPGLRREESTAPASIAPKVARFLFGRPGIAGNSRESSKQSYAGCSPRRRATGSFCPREKGPRFPPSISSSSLHYATRSLVRDSRSGVSSFVSILLCSLCLFLFLFLRLAAARS